ncbi:hypothetical protein, partial [Chitinimonas sp.]|uniref:hypothetical protein n=1 Tax=Chitinimonas sp. TaxID=1934313 RepID=UPI0035B31307
MKRCLTALFALVLCTLAYAHKPSDSYLTLSQQEAAPQLHMQWDIAIRDLDMALGLDHDLDGKVTWGELQAAEARLQSYAFEHLRVNAGGQVCVPLYRGLQVDKHVDGMYAVINAELSCAAADSYQVDYSLLFEFDRLHKGIVTLKQGASNQVAIASADQHTVTIKANGTGLIKQLGQFVKEGVWHIWIGFDHILFLISLLIP